MASYGDIINGLTIFAKYSEKGMADHGVDAQHDVIYGFNDDEVECGDDFDDVCDDESAFTRLAGSLLHPDDQKALIFKYGWHFDRETSCWARFT